MIRTRRYTGSPVCWRPEKIPLYVARRLDPFCQRGYRAWPGQSGAYSGGICLSGLAILTGCLNATSIPGTHGDLPVYGTEIQFRLRGLRTLQGRTPCIRLAEPVPFSDPQRADGLMKKLHYGEGYQYAHQTEDKIAAMQCMPDSLKEVLCPHGRGK